MHEHLDGDRLLWEHHTICNSPWVRQAALGPLKEFIELDNLLAHQALLPESIRPCTACFSKQLAPKQDADLFKDRLSCCCLISFLLLSSPLQGQGAIEAPTPVHVLPGLARLLGFHSPSIRGVVLDMLALPHKCAQLC